MFGEKKQTLALENLEFNLSLIVRSLHLRRVGWFYRGVRRSTSWQLKTLRYSNYPGCFGKMVGTHSSNVAADWYFSKIPMFRQKYEFVWVPEVWNLGQATVSRDSVVCEFCLFWGVFLFLVWATTSNTQGLLLALVSEITPGKLGGTYGMAGIEPLLVPCKVNCPSHCVVTPAPRVSETDRAMSPGVSDWLALLYYPQIFYWCLLYYICHPLWVCATVISDSWDSGGCWEEKPAMGVAARILVVWWRRELCLSACEYGAQGRRNQPWKIRDVTLVVLFI